MWLLWGALCLLTNRTPGRIACPASGIYHNGQRKAVLPRLHHLNKLLRGALHPAKRLVRLTASQYTSLHRHSVCRCARHKEGTWVKRSAGTHQASHSNEAARDNSPCHACLPALESTSTLPRPHCMPRTSSDRVHAAPTYPEGSCSASAAVWLKQ